MAQLSKHNDWYFCSLITGPRNWRVGMLIVNGDYCDDVNIIVDPPVGHFTNSDNKIAVNAIIESFKSFITGYSITSIRFPAGSSTDPSGFARCAQLIAKKMIDKSEWSVV